MKEGVRKLLVVDGSNLLFQMFYGMPARIVNQAGKPIHGTLGFVGALLKIVRMTEPTHAVVFFVGEVHNERKDIDPQYKANRPDYSLLPEEETPFSQLPDIYKALDFLRIPYAETTSCETDDLVAACAVRYGKEGEVIVASFDSDFFQLVTPSVRILRYRGEKTTLCDEAFVRERFGVPPCQYADFKALVGDGSDNLKGAYKVGPKTAAGLLKRFGDLPTLLERVDEIEKDGVRKSVKEAAERLLTNRRLIVLSGEQSIPFRIEELAFGGARCTTGEVLTAIGVK